MSCEPQALVAGRGPLAALSTSTRQVALRRLRRMRARRTSLPGTPPAKGSRLVYLDLLRAAAILLVLGAHSPFRQPENSIAGGLFTIWHRMGWIGVDLFFVLSGFLVGGLLFQEHRRHGHVRYGRFLTRRAFKIWPAYLTFLMFAFAWDLIEGSGSWRTRLSDTAGRGWPYLLHVQNYYGPLVERIGHTWSLAVEEHFYLLLPLLLIAMTWLASRRPQSDVDGQATPSTAQPFRALPWLYLACAIACLTFRIAAWRRHKTFDEFVHHWPTHLRIDSLMAGVVLAYTVQFGRHRIEALRPWRYLIGLAALACFAPFARESFDYASVFAYTIGYTLLAVGAAGLVLLAWFEGTPAPGAEATTTTAHPALRGVARIGAYSYSIYLWHMPLMIPVMRIAGRELGNHLHLWASPWFFAAEMAVYLGLSLSLGIVMFYAIEMPALALRERWFPSRTAAIPPVDQKADAATIDPAATTEPTEADPVARPVAA